MPRRTREHKRSVRRFHFVDLLDYEKFHLPTNEQTVSGLPRLLAAGARRLHRAGLQLVAGSLFFRDKHHAEENPFIMSRPSAPGEID